MCEPVTLLATCRSSVKLIQLRTGLPQVGQALSLRAAHFDSRPLSVSDIDVAWRVENESEKGGSVSRLNSGGLSSTAEDDPQAAQMVFLKLSLQLPGVKSGASVAQFIGDTSKRTLWDHDVKTYQVHRQLVNTDHDAVVRMTRKSGGGRPPVEFVLLRSIRSDDVDGTHLLAYVFLLFDVFSFVCVLYSCFNRSTPIIAFDPSPWSTNRAHQTVLFEAVSLV